MPTDTERIRIRMEAYDHRALDTSAKQIVEQVRSHGFAATVERGGRFLFWVVADK